MSLRAPAILALLVLAAVAGACFRKEKKGQKLLAPAESTGPKPFYLNEPIAPLSAQPVILSWTPSSNATAYEAVVGSAPACAPVVSQQLGLVEPQMAVSVPDGTYYLCVTAKDDAGRRRAAANDGIKFIVQTASPKAGVVQVPTELDAPASVTVNGAGIIGFSYKAGPADAVDCLVADGYSNELSVKAPISLEIEASEVAREWVLCLLGMDAAGNRQAPAAPTVVRWLTYGAGRRFALSVSEVVGDAAAPGGVLTIVGTGASDWTTAQSATFSMERLSTGTCLSAGLAAFDAPCPNPLPLVFAAGATTWSVALATSILTEGEAYKAQIQAQDAALGLLADAGHATFAWRFGSTLIEGEGDFRRVVSTVGDVIGADVDGGFVFGALKNAAPQGEASSDWVVAKRGAWAQRLGGTKRDSLRQVALSAEGDVAAVGVSAGDFVAGTATLPAVDGEDIVVVKLAGSDGTPLWSRRIGSSKEDYAGGVQFDAAGDVLVFGAITDAADFGDGKPVTPDGCAFFLARYAGADGALIDVVTYDTAGWCWNRLSLAADGRGGWLLAGATGGTITFGATTLAPTGDSSGLVGFVVRLDAERQTLWAQGVSDAASPMIAAAAADAAGNVYAVGRSDTHVLIVGFDGFGARLWQHVALVEGGGFDPFGIVAGASGVVYVTGELQGSVKLGVNDVSALGYSDLLFAGFSGADGSFGFARALGGEYDQLGPIYPTLAAKTGTIVFSRVDEPSRIVRFAP